MSRIVVYRGSRMQRGSGLGNVLKKAAKVFIPWLWPAAKTLGKNVLRGVGGVAKEAAITAGTSAANKLIKKASGKANTLAKSSNIGKAAVGKAAQVALDNTVKAGNQLLGQLGQKRKAAHGPPTAPVPKKRKKTAAPKKKRKRSLYNKITYLD